MRDAFVARNVQLPLEFLPRSGMERDSMEEFLEPLRLLLGALGTPVLKPIVESASKKLNRADSSGLLSEEVLYFEVDKTGMKAKGLSTDEGFVVLSGSLLRPKRKSHFLGATGRLETSCSLLFLCSACAADADFAL